MGENSRLIWPFDLESNSDPTYPRKVSPEVLAKTYDDQDFDYTRNDTGMNLTNPRWEKPYNKLKKPDDTSTEAMPKRTVQDIKDANSVVPREMDERYANTAPEGWKNRWPRNAQERYELKDLEEQASRNAISRRQ